LDAAEHPNRALKIASIPRRLKPAGPECRAGAEGNATALAPFVLLADSASYLDFYLAFSLEIPAAIL